MCLFFLLEALKMTARPSKRPDYSLQRNSQKRGLYISSLLFPMVVLFSIAYVYQLTPSQKSKFSLHLKNYEISRCTLYVLNSYYTVLIDIFLQCFCLTICFVVSIHNLQSGLQVLKAFVEVSTESFSICNILSLFKMAVQTFPNLQNQQSLEQ